MLINPALPTSTVANNGEIEAPVLCKLDRCFAGGRGSYVIALPGENHLQDFTLRFFVVNYEYAFARHVLCQNHLR